MGIPVFALIRWAKSFDGVRLLFSKRDMYIGDIFNKSASSAFEYFRAFLNSLRLLHIINSAPIKILRNVKYMSRPILHNVEENNSGIYNLQIV